jgi:hypothetical protein
MKKILLSILILGVLWADYTISYRFDDGENISIIETMQYKNSKNIKLSYHYRDDASIIQTGLYRIDNIDYIVNIEDDKKLTYTIIDKKKHIKGSFDSKREPFFKIIKKLDKEYMAGFNCEIWAVESTEDGVTEQENIVVCSNKELVKAVKDYFHIMKDFGEGANGQEFDEELESMFMVAEGYVLVGAKGIELVSFEKGSIPSSIFSLPKGTTKHIEE